MSRGRFLKVRVSDAELADIRRKAVEADMTVSDLMRFRLCNQRLRQTAADKERLRQLARIGSNINQLARWANTFKNRAEVVQVLAALWSMEQSLQNANTPLPQGASREEPPCI